MLGQQQPCSWGARQEGLPGVLGLAPQRCEVCPKCNAPKGSCQREMWVLGLGEVGAGQTQMGSVSGVGTLRCVLDPSAP